MPGGSKNVELKLQVTDLTNNRLREFVDDLISLRDAAKALNGAQDPQTKILDQQAKQLKDLSKHFGEADDNARKFSRTISGMGAGRNFLSSALGGAGFGTAGSLIGLAGAAAAISAAGLLVGQSTRMAYDFERITTKVASQFAIGSGSTIASNLAQIRVAAYSGQAFGFDALQMTGAMAAYGAASGSTASQIAGAGPNIARYARAYGLDPATVATMVGGYQAYGGGTFEGNASGLFGAAEDGGPLGRRIGEFIGTATNVLSSLQLGNPNANVDVNQASGIVSGISRLGGIYGTAQGVLSTEAAAAAMTQGGNNDIRRAALMHRAGLSDRDIILGVNTPQNQRRIYDELLKETGGTQSAFFWSNLVGMVGQDNARLLIGAQTRNGGSTSFLDNYNRTQAPLEDRLSQAMKTPAAQIDATLADIKNTMIADGDKLVRALAPLGAGNITTLLTVIAAATAVNGASTLFGGKGLPGIIGGAAGRALPWLSGGSLAAAAASLGSVFFGSTSFAPVTDSMQAVRLAMANNDYALNASRDELGTDTSMDTVKMLATASRNARLRVTALGLMSHHNDSGVAASGISPHAWGQAFDIDKVGSHVVGANDDPYIRAWLLQQIKSNPYARQFGLGSAYYDDPAIQAAIREAHKTEFPDDYAGNSHIHMGTGVMRDIRAHGVKISVAISPDNSRPNTGNRRKGTPTTARKGN